MRAILLWIHAAVAVGSSILVVAGPAGAAESNVPEALEAIDAASPDDRPSEETKKKLQSIVDGYTANKSAFTFGKCRYTYTTYAADTEQDALESKRNNRRPANSSECRFCFRDDLLASTQKQDDDSTGMLKNGKYAIQFNSAVAVVHSPDNTPERLNVRLQPFNLALDSEFIDPASIIISAQARNFEGSNFVVQDRVAREQQEFLLLTLKSKGGSHDARWFIDTNRGYLPFIKEYFHKDGKPESRMFLLKVHQEGKAWFPLHAMWITPVTNNGASYVNVREMKVLDFDFKAFPRDEDFVVQILRRAQYHDGVHANTASTLFREGEGDFHTVSVNDIETIHKRLLEVAAERVKPTIASCVCKSFGWLIPSSSLRHGQVQFGQISAQTEPGQCFYLAANESVRKELKLSQEQSDQYKSMLAFVVTKMVSEAKESNLTYTEAENLQHLPVDDRVQRIRTLNDLMREAEQRFIGKFVAELREIFTAEQYARLRQIRRQVVGSQSLGEMETIEALGLTQEQQQKIAAINKESLDSLVTFYASEFDTGNGDYRELMTKVQKRLEDRNKRALDALTPQQREQLDQLNGARFDTSDRIFQVEPRRPK